MSTYREFSAHLYREVIDGVPVQLARAEMALVRALEEGDACAELCNLLLLLLELHPLLLDFLVGNALYTWV